MKSKRIIIFFIIIFLFSNAAKSEVMKLSVVEYNDRVKAMWLAQMLAVHQGWDFEHSPAAVNEISEYSPKRLKTIIDNGAATIDDDWYYEMVALFGFEKYGIDMTVDQLGQQWLDYDMGTWGSAFYTRQALLKGINGEMAGFPKNNRMWFTVGNQNRSDLYAMFTPGMPNLTAKISRYLGHVNSYAEGTDGGVLIGVLESMAFYETNHKKLLEKSLKILDPASPHRICGEEIIRLAKNGASWKTCMRYVEEKWGIEYPGTNSAVWNGGFAMVALYFGEGDILKSINLAYKASDFSDADCQAANVATILAAMHGTKILPDNMIKPFNDRIKGEYLGFMKLKEPVDMSISELANRTAAIGIKMMQKNGVVIKNGILYIPINRKLTTQQAELFHPNEFVKWWNPDWELSRAGYGAPGGGVRGIRGGTFIDDSVLVTYPRDEVRGVKLERKIKLGDQPFIKLSVAADPGRKWMLMIYVEHDRVFRKIIDGGEALKCNDPDENYPQPLLEYEESKKIRKFEQIEVDLSPFKGKEITIRLYQSILVRNGFPGNAYWKNVIVE